MKHIATYALGLLALAACSSDDTDIRTSGGRTELRLSGGIEVMTRADVQSTQIVDGETVYAWVMDAGNPTVPTDLYNAISLTANGAQLNGQSMYFPQTGNNVNVRALHGTFADNAFVDEGGNGVSFPSSVGFSVAADQSVLTDATADRKANYIKSDLLYAAVDGVAPGGNSKTVKLSFYHMLSKLKLNIKKGDGVTDNVTSVTLDGVALTGTFTLTTAAADLSDVAKRPSMIVAGEQNGVQNITTSYDESNEAIVVPQDVAGKTMTFTLASNAKLVYTFPADKKFESGKEHVYNVTLNMTGLQVEAQIEDWDNTGNPDESNGSATIPAPSKD